MRSVSAERLSHAWVWYGPPNAIETVFRDEVVIPVPNVLGGDRRDYDGSVQRAARNGRPARGAAALADCVCPPVTLSEKIEIAVAFAVHDRPDEQSNPFYQLRLGFVRLDAKVPSSACRADHLARNTRLVDEHDTFAVG